MSKKLLTFFCASVIVGLWISGGSVSGAMAQDECSDGVAGHPLAPEMPGRLVAFREAGEGVSEPLHDIRLHWINNSNNANCFSVEVNFSSRPGVA